MVTLNNKKNGVTQYLNNNGVEYVLDALLHEMERYNKAMDLCTDAGVQKTCTDAKHRIFTVHRMFCQLLNDDDDEQ